MSGTPVYSETFLEHTDAAIANDNDALLEVLEQMDRDTAPKGAVR